MLCRVTYILVNPFPKYSNQLKQPYKILPKITTTMSNQQSSYTSYSSTSYTTSSTSNGSQPITQSYSETANYDSRTGGNITRESRETGQPTLTQTRDIPVQGQVEGSSADTSRRIEDVTDAEQAERDRQYEERMEDEYAKREGGA